jgi:hypothetical protein
LNGGTANGVLFLNGSKVATSGSALTFDGTTLGVGGTGATGLSFEITAATSGFAAKTAAANFNYVAVYQTSSFTNIESGFSGSATPTPMRFLAGGAERARISTDGTFRVTGAGTAGSTDAVQFSGSAPANRLILDSSGRFLVSGTSGTLARFGTDTGNGTTNFFPVLVGDGDSATPGTNRNFVRIGRFSDGTAGIDAFAAGVGNAALSFGTFGTQRMFISSDGNLGLGAAPGAWFTGGNFETPSASISVVLGVDQTAWATGARQTSYSGSWLSRGAYRATLYEQQTGLHVWYSSTTLPTAAGQVISFTQAMTLDLTGNLLLACTGLTGDAPNVDGSFLIQSTAGNMKVRRGLSAHQYIQFYGTSTSSPIGSISNVSNTSVAYNTSSDYRLKENIQTMTGALAKVAALKPCTFNWIENGSAGQGFIAHELAEVVPDCVTGEKDAVNEDGSIKPQGVDTSFLVATLTAAIQELKAEFDAYKATHP